MLSMTGYGKVQLSEEGREITVELKSVNHRFLDISCRLPRALAFAEDALRKTIGQYLKRGHVDVFVNYQNTRQDARTVRVDTALALQYQDAVKALCEATGAENDLKASYYAQLPDVVTVEVAQDDQDAVLNLLKEAAKAALMQMVDMRRKEGEALYQDLASHLALMEEQVAVIAKRAPEVPKLYQERLLARLQDMQVNELDEQRLAQEVALMADHCAIDEELSRLSSHIAQTRQVMAQQGETGRKLDFLVQEMNREVNTIGSKASDAGITKCVVAAKSEIEKLREQVQNVE